MLDGPGMEYQSPWTSFSISRTDSNTQYSFWFEVTETDDGAVVIGECQDENGMSYETEVGIPISGEDLWALRWMDFDQLPEEERVIFEEGFELLNRVQREAWTEGVEDSVNNAIRNQGVTFIYPDTEPFRMAVMPLHTTVLSDIPEIQAVYDKIQEYNLQDGSESGMEGV